MPGKTSEAMLNDLFAEINNLIMPADLSVGAPPPAGFVTMAVPGTTVVKEDFDPSTPRGKNNLYAFMDRLPAVNKQYVDSAKRCSDMYAQVLSATPPKDKPEEAAKKEAAYNEALSKLTNEVLDVYEDCQDKYLDARDVLLSLQNDPASSQDDLRHAKRAADRAWTNWTTRGKKQLVEANLSVCSAYLLCTPTAVFAEANRVYEESRDVVSGLRPVSCTPSDWAVDPEKLSWATVVVKHGTSVSKLHDYTRQIDSSFSANFSGGLWSASASGGYHDRVHELNESSQVDNLGMSFEIARVDVQRDWFKGSLLTYPGTTIPGYAAGSLCAGSLAEASKCTFPFVPTSFVVARNIAIYNEFTEEERSFFEESESWSASAQVGYGPFSISNDTSVSTDLTDDEKKEFGDSIKIEVGKGMQIIGFVNSILTPAFPAASDTYALALGLDDVGMGGVAIRSIRQI